MEVLLVVAVLVDNLVRVSLTGIAVGVYGTASAVPYTPDFVVAGW